MLSNTQWCEQYPTENISDYVVADTVSNTFYSKPSYTQQQAIL